MTNICYYICSYVILSLKQNFCSYVILSLKQNFCSYVILSLKQKFCSYVILSLNKILFLCYSVYKQHSVLMLFCL